MQNKITKISEKRGRAPSKKKDAEKARAALVLEDGSYWPGYAFGAPDTFKIGELVFHTAHSGYQEILTDPSYQSQILVFSQVQIGNQGFSQDDFESSQVWASGCVVRDYSESLFHWRQSSTLSDVLKKDGCPGIFGVDTRRLILHLREQGNLWGILSTETDDIEKLSGLLDRKLSMEGLSLTEKVSTKKSYQWTENSSSLVNEGPDLRKGTGLKKCVVVDFGVKRQILRYLVDSGFEEVLVVPAKTTLSELKSLAPDAILLSNGPGDPSSDPEIIENVRSLIREGYPMLGICLGHQILGLALGLPTFKMKFGHHGANHPVKNLETGRVEISSHNHGFAVQLDENAPYSKEIEITHINLNDGTLEGFRHKKLPLRAIQFHPESAPGPMDSFQIFNEFQRGFSA